VLASFCLRSVAPHCTTRCPSGSNPCIHRLWNWQVLAPVVNEGGLAVLATLLQSTDAVLLHESLQLARSLIAHRRIANEFIEVGLPLLMKIPSSSSFQARAQSHLPIPRAKSHRLPPSRHGDTALAGTISSASVAHFLACAPTDVRLQAGAVGCCLWGLSSLSSVMERPPLAKFTPGLGSRLPHPPWDWAHPCHLQLTTRPRLLGHPADPPSC
jgi:hypothetical protein